MDLILNRITLKQTYTIGHLFINGELICYTLEDKDRGLDKDMFLYDISKIKVKGNTAIPTGEYRMIISYSPRLKIYCPEVLDVPGFNGIRIHPGNTDKDTLGCILPGQEPGKGMVLKSRLAFIDIMEKLTAVEKIEEITIQIK